MGILNSDELAGEVEPSTIGYTHDLTGIICRLAAIEGFIKGFAEMLEIRLKSIDDSLARLETKRRTNKTRRI